MPVSASSKIILLMILTNKEQDFAEPPLLPDLPNSLVFRRRRLRSLFCAVGGQAPAAPAARGHELPELSAAPGGGLWVPSRGEGDWLANKRVGRGSRNGTHVLYAFFVAKRRAVRGLVRGRGGCVVYRER